MRIATSSPPFGQDLVKTVRTDESLIYLHKEELLKPEVILTGEPFDDLIERSARRKVVNLASVTSLSNFKKIHQVERDEFTVTLVA